MPEDVEFFVFDAFGTLFDVHSAAKAHASQLGAVWPQVSEIWRLKQLEYSWIHAALGTHIPFRDCTRAGLAYALKTSGLQEELVQAILDGYRRLATFAEVPGVLAALRAQQAKIAILSNGDPDMLEELVAAAGIGHCFDALLSVQSAGTFKPNPRVYQLACDRFEVPAGAIKFVSSNRWDIAGASNFGFAPTWVNRLRLPDEYPHHPPVRMIADLAELLIQK